LLNYEKSIFFPFPIPHCGEEFKIMLELTLYFQGPGDNKLLIFYFLGYFEKD